MCNADGSGCVAVPAYTDRRPTYIYTPVAADVGKVLKSAVDYTRSGTRYRATTALSRPVVASPHLLTLTAASQALPASNDHAGDMYVDFTAQASSTRRFTLQGRTYELHGVAIFDTYGRLEIASLTRRVGSSPPDYSLPAAVRNKLHIRATFASPRLRRNMVIEAAYTDLRLFGAGYYSLYAAGDTADFLREWRVGADDDAVTIDLFTAPTTQQTQSLYRRATSTPTTPSGGTRTEQHVPSGWQTSQPTPTATQGVYRSQRTVTYREGVFHLATAWGAPTRVAAPTGLSVGHVDYCKQQGPCRAGQGDCDGNNECRSGLTCVNDVGANYGWAANIDVCEASVRLGDNDYCRDRGPCRAGQGDCDSDRECQSGLTCVHDVGAKYGWRAIVDVCEARTTQRWDWQNLSTQPLTVGDRAGDLLANHALNFTYAGRRYHIQHLQVSRPAGSRENQICVRTNNTFAQAALDNLEIRVDLDGSTAYVAADFSADLVGAGYHCFSIKAGGRYTFTNRWRALGSDNSIDVVIRTR